MMILLYVETHMWTIACVVKLTSSLSKNSAWNKENIKKMAIAKRFTLHANEITWYSRQCTDLCGYFSRNVLYVTINRNLIINSQS